MNYSLIKQQLHKNDSDYYVVVPELPVETKTSVPQTTSQTVVKTPETSQEKTAKRHNNDNALGQSLSDILHTESESSKHLKVFDNQNKPNEQ